MRHGCFSRGAISRLAVFRLGDHGDRDYHHKRSAECSDKHSSPDSIHHIADHDCFPPFAELRTFLMIPHNNHICQGVFCLQIRPSRNKKLIRQCGKYGYLSCKMLFCRLINKNVYQIFEKCSKIKTIQSARKTYVCCFGCKSPNNAYEFLYDLCVRQT